MSWAIRAHIRNVMLKASLGASFHSSAELKKGSAALCSVEMCPYPGYRSDVHHPPPTDDRQFAAKQLKMALELHGEEFRVPCLSTGAQDYLFEKIESPITADLLADLFWWRYLSEFGIRYASKTATGTAKENLESFRSVLTDMFIESDTDGSGEVDAAELSDILSGLGVQLPAEVCRDLINLVDENGNGMLELDEFLEMMCVEVIADCSVVQVKADAEEYKQRSCRLWWDLFLPTGEPDDLTNRDATLPIYCRLLARGIHGCFNACFVSHSAKEGSLFGPRLRTETEEEFALLFLGARRPNLPPPQYRPLSARSRSVRATSRTSVATAPTTGPKRIQPTPPTAQPRKRPMTAGAATGRRGPISSVKEAPATTSTTTGSVSRTPTAIHFDFDKVGDITTASESHHGSESTATTPRPPSPAESHASSEGVAESLQRMRREARPHLYEPHPYGRDIFTAVKIAPAQPKRTASFVRGGGGGDAADAALIRRQSTLGIISPRRGMSMMGKHQSAVIKRKESLAPEEDIPLPPKIPGQPPPPVPTLNMLGCSPAFSALFPTNPPSQNLHTIQRVHYAAAFTPRKYSARQQIAEKRKNSAVEECRAATARVLNRGNLLDAPSLKEESGARLFTKHARRDLKQLAEQRTAVKRGARESFASLCQRWELAKPYLEPSHETRHDSPGDLAGAFEILKADAHSLMDAPLYRQLNMRERLYLREMATVLGKDIAALRREVHHRACRVANASMQES